MGLAARPALDGLKALRDDNEQEVRSAAATVLKKIQ
jgi:hypothetical protein